MALSLAESMCQHDFGKSHTFELKHNHGAIAISSNRS